MPSLVTPPACRVVLASPAALPSTVTVSVLGIVPASVEPPRRSKLPAPAVALSVSVLPVMATGLPVCWLPAAWVNEAPLLSVIVPVSVIVPLLVSVSPPALRLSSPASAPAPPASIVSVPSLTVAVFWSWSSWPEATTM